jgi:hypothetical protein
MIFFKSIGLTSRATQPILSVTNTKSNPNQLKAFTG